MLIIWGPLLAGGGILVLLFGVLGVAMTGTTETGAGTMMIVGLVPTVVGIAMTLGALLIWSRD